MSAEPDHGDHEPSGERFVPESMGGQLIEAEHQARYRFALPFVAGRRVLDAGCGTGWGSQLLMDAGAREVVALDISEEAIDASRKRAADAALVRGDLEHLPLRPGSFDVVVCFEALEHTHDTSSTLDGLVSLLADDGLLFVSSPNPGVYPAGNPFHFHELGPEELRQAVTGRLPHVALYRQHLHLASTIVPDDPATTTFSCRTYSVVPMGGGNDPYSIVVAGRLPLPTVEAAQALSPSDQLTNLDAAGGALADERRAMLDEQTRITEERRRVLAQLDESGRQLVEAGDALAGVMAERDDAMARLVEAGEALANVMAERDDAMARLVEAGEALAGVMAERDAAAAQVLEASGLYDQVVAERDGVASRLDAALRSVETVARERDRFATALVLVEQELAAAKALPDGTEAATLSDSELQVRLDELRTHAGRLEQELVATQSTVSWRLTAPLRRVRTHLRLPFHR